MLPVANPKVIYKALSDGAVLFSTEDEVYFGLNEVGACVWELLPPATRTIDELCAAIARRYPDAEPSVIRSDVAELLAELLKHRLVLQAEGTLSDESDDHSSQADQTASARVG